VLQFQGWTSVSLSLVHAPCLAPESARAIDEGVLRSTGPAAHQLPGLMVHAPGGDIPPGALKPGLLPYGAGSVMTLESSVIAPLVQTNLPSTLEPVPTEFDAWANTVPLKSTFDPRVDEDPIAQNTLAAFAPLISTTLEPVFAVSADPSWKIQTAF